MKVLQRLRGSLIRGLRRPVAALSGSVLGRRLLRGWLSVLGGEATLELHDEVLSWLTLRRLPGNRGRLVRRLRRGARTLRFRPGILHRRNDTEGSDELRTLVVLWSLSKETVATVVEELQDARDRDPSLTPIFVTDCDDFDAFRKRSCVFEYIPERQEWTRHHGTAGWIPYVSRRIDEILETWDPDRVLMVDDSDGETLRRDGLWSALLRDA